MRRLTALAALTLALGGCATIPPPESAAPFRHDAFDRVLRAFVDAEGLVDYAALAEDRAELDTYLRALRERSPDTHPRAFPSEADRFAYWINAYNAITIHFVLAHHPLGSVQDVAPLWTRPLPDGAGFFFALRYPIGGDPTSLYALENRIVRARFPDARLHFALNCASLGCPVLPAEAFVPGRLEEQLTRETARFFAGTRNLRIDAERRVVEISEILLWYRGDYERWQRHRGADPTLLAFVADHLGDAERAAALRRAEAAGFRIERIPYDWRLNDTALGPRP